MRHALDLSTGTAASGYVLRGRFLSSWQGSPRRRSGRGPTLAIGSIGIGVREVEAIGRRGVPDGPGPSASGWLRGVGGFAGSDPETVFISDVPFPSPIPGAAYRPWLWNKAPPGPK